jgi:hypothetical protein
LEENKEWVSSNYNFTTNSVTPEIRKDKIINKRNFQSIGPKTLII